MARFRGSRPADGAEPEHAEEPEERPRRREGRLAGPEAADEFKGIGDIADLLREVGRERRRLGEDLLRLFEERWEA